MAEKGSRTPAGAMTALENLVDITKGGRAKEFREGSDVTDRLREELAAKGLKGFKRGGKVKKTGVAKVHKGERVLSAKQAKKSAVKTAIRKPAARTRRR
jgi:hypothetical protein